MLAAQSDIAKYHCLYTLRVVACQTLDLFLLTQYKFQFLAFKDPVLPMILSCVTMNFMLYEKKLWPSNRKALMSFQPSNESCEVSFLLLCPSFDDQRRDLLAGIEELLRPFVQIANLSNDALTQLLLYGDKDLSYEMNSDILRLTIHFIRETGRFD